jgi:Flp pilus assembly protein TadD
MSVLYKALARASKARETLRPEPVPTPRLPFTTARPPRRHRLRLLVLVLAGSSVIALGVFLWFGGPLLSDLDQVTVAAPKTPGPRKLPAMAQHPAAEVPSAPAGTPQQSTAPDSAPVQTVIAPPSPPASPAPLLPSPEPAPPPVAVVVPMAPALPAVTPPAAVSPAQGPAVVAAPATGKLASKPRMVQAEEDLPSILDRIRRERTAPAMAQAVTVDRRTATADLTGRDGVSSIAVSVTAAPNHEDVNTAYDMLMHGQYEGALGLYEKVLKTAPKSVPAWLGKGTAEHKLRRTIAARDSYRKVLAIDPDNREALTNMTAIVADQAPDQALAELRGLQKSYPSFSPIPAQIASIEARQDNVAGAISALNAAIAQSPDNGLYRLNLAVLQDRAGMRDEAAASYRLAIDMLGAASGLPVPLDQIRQRLRYLQGR